MSKSKTVRFTFFTFVLAMVVSLVLLDGALADHSRKRGRSRDKKAEKFINGHDARDGRLDGRGPRVRDRRGDWDDDDWRDDRRPRRKRRR